LNAGAVAVAVDQGNLQTQQAIELAGAAEEVGLMLTEYLKPQN
jgi:hypothetical protein